jgi:hypothetical protein
MHRKKIICLLHTLLLLSAIIPATIGLTAGTATAEVSGTFQYSLIGNGTAVEITGYTGSGGSVVIPSVIAGEPVTSIAERAFYNCTSLTSVTIPISIIKIGAESFYNCYALTSITIPNSVTSIGKGAFFDCGLKSVVIPNSVTIIDDRAFFDCYSLASVTIPFSITSIGNYSFGGCYSLTAVTIPNSVTSIGKGAFYSCGLRSVTIPSSVGKIDDRSFQGCYALASVTISVGITNIGDYSFYNCYALKSVTITNNVSSLGEYIFGNCYALTSVSIASSVISIGDDAFYNCYALTAITFYGNAPSIGNGWKTGCGSNLTVYYYQGASGFANSSWYGVASLEMASPIAPQTLVAATGDGSVKLTWKAPSSGVSGNTINYIVYQNSTDVKHLTSNSLTITGLTNGQTYNFTVVALRTLEGLHNSTSIIVKLPTLGVVVDGTVYNKSGGPVINATVSLSNNMTVMTNDFGQFIFSEVREGNFSLLITKDGYKTVTQNVTVDGGKNVDLDSVIMLTDGSSPITASSSGDDMTLIIVIVVIAVVAAVVLLFFLKQKKGFQRKKKSTKARKPLV